MSESRPLGRVEFGGRATYRIVVQGTLPGHWSNRLGGLVVTATHAAEEEPRTTLTGVIQDQAELNGVLDTLYGLHLSILKVEKVDDDP
jgi:hypothetical protein